MVATRRFGDERMSVPPVFLGGGCRDCVLFGVPAGSVWTDPTRDDRGPRASSKVLCQVPREPRPDLVGSVIPQVFLDVVAGLDRVALGFGLLHVGIRLGLVDLVAD